MESVSSGKSREELIRRYQEIKLKLRKTHLCGYYFRQRCMRFKDTCEHAHGFSDMKRMTSMEILSLKQELFNIKQCLNRNNNVVLYNPKSKRFEIYKTKEINKLRQLIQEGGIEGILNGATAVENENDDEEEEGEAAGNGEESKNKGPGLRRSIINLNLDECTIIDKIEYPEQLHNFDMAKALDSDDE